MFREIGCFHGMLKWPHSMKEAEARAGEAQSAAEYDDRTTPAVKSVLIEIGQILGSFKGKFAIIGGAVPWLLLANAGMPRVGTLDVDIGLDAEALGDGEYATLIGALLRARVLRD